MSDSTNPHDAYPAGTADAVAEHQDEIKHIYDEKIEEMKKNGFYVDLLENNRRTTLELLEDLYTNPMSNAFVPDYKTSDHFELVREYSLNGDRHSFIHVNPNGFTFEQVDFDNMSSVLDIRSQSVYANKFWGIYLKNDTLKIHELVQFDMYRKFFAIRSYNMYDGGNDILGYSSRAHYIGFGQHNGAVYFSWKDLVDVRRSIIDFANSSAAKKVEDCKKQISKVEASNEALVSKMQSEIDQLLELC